MSETEVAAPKSHRRRWIIIATVVVLVVVALVVGSFLYASNAASSKASTYADQWSAWKGDHQKALLAATDGLPSGIYGSKNTISAKSLKSQRAGCGKIADAAKEVDDAKGDLPTMGSSGLLRAVSSDYSDAGDRADRRDKAVRAYAKAADRALAQLERDCRWNIRYNRSIGKTNALFVKSSSYLLKGGGREPGAVCRVANGCVSSISEKKNKYADFRLKAIAAARKGSLSLLQSDECHATSYGEKGCAALATSLEKNLDVQEKAFTYVRSTASSIDNPRISEDLKKIAKAQSSGDKSARAAILAAVPAAKETKRSRKYPIYSDYFFPAAAKQLYGELKDERAAISSL